MRTKSIPCSVLFALASAAFPTTAHALAAGKAALDAGRTHYCPSMGLPEFRVTAAKFVNDEFGIPATAENIVVGPGAKVFETYFCELFLEPGDEVLLFDPVFPTYVPNVLRRGGVPVLNRRTSSPRRWSAPESPADVPSPARPPGVLISPVCIKAWRNVPVVNTTARARYSTSPRVRTPSTRGPAGVSSVNNSSTDSCRRSSPGWSSTMSLTSN